MTPRSTILAAALLLFAACSNDAPTGANDEAGSEGAVPVSGGLGGWFCCTPGGGCSYISTQNTQDCPTGNTVKWCKVVKTAEDGSKSCSEWGE